MSEGAKPERSLGDELMSLGAPEPVPTERRVLRWREFSPRRWLGLALVLVGIPLLGTWWLGPPLAVLGVALVLVDNHRLLRPPAP